MMPQVFCMVDISPEWWATSTKDRRDKAANAIRQEDRYVLIYNEELRLQIGLFVRPDEVQHAVAKRKRIEIAVEYACIDG